jgi:hypothetical protein
VSTLTTPIPTKHDARVAGAWYLAMIVTGAIGILCVPMQIVDGGPAAIASNLVARADLVRVGIFASIVC